jgi:hypothetical protein
MVRKINLLIIVLVAIVFVQCKSTSKTRKTKDIKKTENEKRADAFFYHIYSKKLGYELAGNEDIDFLQMVDAWLGVPYKYGGCTKEGTDCSCFVATFYKDFYKLNLPRKSEDMQKLSKEIDTATMQSGDLVFFKIKSEKTSHVGIYISKKRFVHSTTSKGVMINSLEEKYYKTYFYKAGRIMQ